MFMVIAKTLIKDHTQLGLYPGDVFSRVNNLLCEGNEAGLFVTAWMGILDLNNGDLFYANAGHNPPILMQDGEPAARDYALLLYFGKSGEPVWDIAKRCRTSVDAVCEENDLAGDTLMEDAMLLIPIVG